MTRDELLRRAINARRSMDIRMEEVGIISDWDAQRNVMRTLDELLAGRVLHVGTLLYEEAIALRTGIDFAVVMSPLPFAAVYLDPATGKALPVVLDTIAELERRLHELGWDG